MLEFSEKITFVIFTYNEEKRIERAIRNFVKYGKILVVDNYSDDSTIEIAKKYGCDVLLNKNPGWVEDEITTAKVFNAVSTDWIYWAYADELVDRKTLEKIQSIIDLDNYHIISVTRKNYYYGKFCHDAFSDRLNRVFRVGSIDFINNKIHQFGKPLVVNNKIFMLENKYFVHHFISNTANSYLKVMDKYTDIQAPRESKYRGLAMLFLQSANCFITHYFINGAFKAGRSGLYLVLNMIYYNWLLSMKKYEYDFLLTADEIERLNDSHRNDILKNIEK